MSERNEWEDDYNDDDRGGDNPIKALRKIEREQKAQIKELTEQLEAMRGQVRERSVKEVLASKGLNEKIAKFIPKDMTSPEDIQSWVDENGDVFGATPAPADSEPETGGLQATDPNIAALERIANSQASGSVHTGDAGQIEALIKSAQSPEELNQLLFGNPNGPTAV